MFHAEFLVTCYSAIIRIGMTMIVLNILFVALNTPYRLFYVANLKISNISLYTRAHLVTNRILGFIFELFYSIVFYVQLAVNCVVRR